MNVGRPTMKHKLSYTIMCTLRYVNIKISAETFVPL